MFWQVAEHPLSEGTGALDGGRLPRSKTRGRLTCLPSRPSHTDMKVRSGVDTGKATTSSLPDEGAPPTALATPPACLWQT